MGLLLLGALLLDRESQLPNALALAGLGLLLWRPGDLWEPGFQLSFAATAGIVHLGPAVTAGLVARGAPGWLAGAVAVSLGAQAAVTPLMLAHFNQLSLIGVVANLLVVPLAAVATTLGHARAAAASWPRARSPRCSSTRSGSSCSRCARPSALAAALPAAMVHLPAPVGGDRGRLVRRARCSRPRSRRRRRVRRVVGRPGDPGRRRSRSGRGSARPRPAARHLPRRRPGRRDAHRAAGGTAAARGRRARRRRAASTWASACWRHSSGTGRWLGSTWSRSRTGTPITPAGWPPSSATSTSASSGRTAARRAGAPETVAALVRSRAPRRALAAGQRLWLGPGADHRARPEPRIRPQTANDQSLVLRLDWRGVSLLLTGDLGARGETALLERAGPVRGARRSRSPITAAGSRPPRRSSSGPARGSR